MDNNSVLINCNSCNKEISCMTDRCPSCGHPNDWAHPLIKKFDTVSDNDFNIEFNYSYGRNWVKGTTGDLEEDLAAKMTVSDVVFSSGGFFMGLMLFLLLLSDTGVAVFFIILFIAWVIYSYFNNSKNRNAHKFYVEFNGNNLTWKSDDDHFWQPVKRYFEN